jgi:hypothetical protein
MTLIIVRGVWLIAAQSECDSLEGDGESPGAKVRARVKVMARVRDRSKGQSKDGVSVII